MQETNLTEMAPSARLTSSPCYLDMGTPNLRLVASFGSKSRLCSEILAPTSKVPSKPQLKAALCQVAVLMANGENWLMPLFLRLEDECVKIDLHDAAISRARALLDEPITQ